jgi:acetate CoA/acetoacetate CoA-transferase beta subunit
VIGFPDGRATLLETAAGVSAEQVLAATDAELAIAANLIDSASKVNQQVPVACAAN